jgi:hypothetical protein
MLPSGRLNGKRQAGRPCEDQRAAAGLSHTPEILKSWDWNAFRLSGSTEARPTGIDAGMTET